jgi:hypothetical protein
MPGYKGLAESDIDPDPFVQFDRWYREHLNSGNAIPDSVGFGSGFANGRVSVRAVTDCFPTGSNSGRKVSSSFMTGSHIKKQRDMGNQAACVLRNIIQGRMRQVASSGHLCLPILYCTRLDLSEESISAFRL